jgi:hypothetical protein
VVVDTHLHKVNPNAERKNHQSPQGMTENHQESKVLGHPSVSGEYG